MTVNPAVTTHSNAKQENQEKFCARPEPVVYIKYHEDAGNTENNIFSNIAVTPAPITNDPNTKNPGTAIFSDFINNSDADEITKTTQIPTDNPFIEI